MANFDATTASNGPLIIPGHESELQKILSRYYIEAEDGPMAHIEGGRLHIYGYGWFNAYKMMEEEGTTDIIPDYDNEASQEFLKTIQPHLAENLVIHSIGNEKCRFPLSAMSITVSAGKGRITYKQL